MHRNHCYSCDALHPLLRLTHYLAAKVWWQILRAQAGKDCVKVLMELNKLLIKQMGHAAPPAELLQPDDAPEQAHEQSVPAAAEATAVEGEGEGETRMQTEPDANGAQGGTVGSSPPAASTAAAAAAATVTLASAAEAAATMNDEVNRLLVHQLQHVHTAVVGVLSQLVRTAPQRRRMGLLGGRCYRTVPVHPTIRKRTRTRAQIEQNRTK
jgi:hypothetical protein